MSKHAKKAKDTKSVELKVVSSTKDIVRPALLQTVLGLGLEQIYEIVEEERAALCGPKHARDPGRAAVRSGTAPSQLVLGGRRISLRRPRVRTMDGQEVDLETWEHFSDEDPLDERAMEQMTIGVATRKYDRSLERSGDEVNTRGTSKSAVSRRFVKGTKKRLDELLNRDLSSLDLVALMIDGLLVGDHVALLAIGVDEGGHKHVLGVQEGATENAAACTDLLTNLRKRGMRTDRSLLVVIDGSKALRKAVDDVFGKRAAIQRCQEHKIRNVTDHLPKDMKVHVRRSMQDAYRCRKPTRAKKLLGNLQRTLLADHPGAAASLAEGLDETLTVLEFGLSSMLERTLGTTNMIENVNGTVRQVTRNVKRWKNGDMVLRWVATALHEARKGFRRVRGYKGLTRLAAALRHRDEEIDDAVEQAAVIA
jgi:transposase-like protein